MQTDFNHLYSRLGLKPGCSLHEFKRAYRRQFAELHPDRPGACARTPEAQEQLREIISMYGSALSFHRRHGRLPGALPAPGTGATGPLRLRQSAAPLNVAPSRIGPAGDVSPTTRGRWLGLLVLGVCVLGLLVAWNNSLPPAPEEQAPAPTAPPPAVGPAAAPRS